MRTFCLILILANVLFFGWAGLIDVRTNALERTTAVKSAAPPRIVLARELAHDTDIAPIVPDSTSQIREISPPSVEPVAEATGDKTDVARAVPDMLTCISVGPFADLANASQAQAALRTSGFEPRQRLEQGEVWVGYWVSVQNLITREAADEALKRLTASGITDTYIMPGTDPANVLSLGVFTEYARAQRRADQVSALGFEPQIDDRKRPGSTYWIDVDLAEPGQTIDLAMFQTDPGKIMRVELRGCPQTG